MTKERVDFSQKFIGELPDWKIAEYIKSDRIKIVPKPEPERLTELLGPVSFDFSLGYTVRSLNAQGLTHVDIDNESLGTRWETHDLRTSAGIYILHQGHFIQAETAEWLELPADIVGHLNGKSSLSRYGLLIHATAPRFDPGWKGRVVLEIRNVGEAPFALKQAMLIAAMEFVELAAPVENPYTTKESSKFKQQLGA